MTCISRPRPESERSSWMSRRRQPAPLMAYSEPPVRNSVREMVTSLYSIGSAPSVLSMVRETCARPSGGRPDVPAKMTSSILPPRRVLAPCSPMTQARASTTLDLPEPFGPDHCSDAGLKVERRGRRERLESPDGQAFEVQGVSDLLSGGSGCCSCPKSTATWPRQFPDLRLPAAEATVTSGRCGDAAGTRGRCRRTGS